MPYFLKNRNSSKHLSSLSSSNWKKHNYNKETLWNFLKCWCNCKRVSRKEAMFVCFSAEILMPSQNFFVTIIKPELTWEEHSRKMSVSPVLRPLWALKVSRIYTNLMLKQLWLSYEHLLDFYFWGGFVVWQIMIWTIFLMSRKPRFWLNNILASIPIATTEH